MSSSTKKWVLFKFACIRKLSYKGYKMQIIIIITQKNEGQPSTHTEQSYAFLDPTWLEKVSLFFRLKESRRYCYTRFLSFKFRP